MLPCARITSVRFKGTFSVDARDLRRAPNTPSGCARPASRSAKRLSQRRRQRIRRVHAEQLVQLRARRRVLQRLRPIRVDTRSAIAIGGERRLVEAADDQLLLARVGVDVADREDARRRGLEALGVDDDLLSLERQAPVGDRPELRAPAEQDAAAASSGRVRVPPSLPSRRRGPAGARRRLSIAASAAPATNSIRPSLRAAWKRSSEALGGIEVVAPMHQR